MKSESEYSPSILLRNNYVIGGFSDIDEAKYFGLNVGHNIAVEFQSGESQSLFFADSLHVNVPPMDTFGASELDNRKDRPALPTRKLQHVVVDKSKGKMLM